MLLLSCLSLTFLAALTSAQTDSTASSQFAIGLEFPGDYYSFVEADWEAAIRNQLDFLGITPYDTLLSLTFTPGNAGTIVATAVFGSLSSISVISSTPFVISVVSGTSLTATIVNPIFGYTSNTGTNNGSGSDNFTSDFGNSNTNGGDNWTSDLGNSNSNNDGNNWVSNVDQAPSYINFTVAGHTYQISTINGVQNATRTLAEQVAAQGAISLALATGAVISAQVFCTAFPEQCDCAIYSAACPASSVGILGTVVSAGTIAGVVAGIVVAVLIVGLLITRSKKKSMRRRISDSETLLPSSRPFSASSSYRKAVAVSAEL